MTNQTYKFLSVFTILAMASAFVSPGSATAQDPFQRMKDYRQERTIQRNNQSDIPFHDQEAFNSQGQDIGGQDHTEQVRAQAEERRAQQEEAMRQQMCQKFSNFASQGHGQFEQRREHVSDHRQDKRAELEVHWGQRRAELEEKRAEARANRQAHFQAMKEKAETDEQTAAVNAFITAMDAAIDKRQAAVDAAQETFRQGVEALMDQKRQSMEAAVQNFRQSMEAAAASAKAECEAGADFQTVMTNFKNAVQQARESMMQSHSPEDMTAQIRALVETRNAAIKAAADEFRVTLQAEVEKLKATFGQEQTDEE